MSGNEVAHLIEDIDGYLCELGLAQIRDGLHILGHMPPRYAERMLQVAHASAECRRPRTAKVISSAFRLPAERTPGSPRSAPGAAASN